MDPSRIASIRKNLEDKSTEELRQALGSGDKAARAPEEREAMRQILDLRQSKGTKAIVAMGAAIVMGTLVGAAAWLQGFPEIIAFLAGVGGALLGFAACYIPGLIGPS